MSYNSFMVRPRQFDDQAVLEQVADVFTAHGYKGTSMQMLVEATGMGKQSLYNAFGDKETLYVHAVSYASSRFANRLTGVQSTKTGLEAIELFFNVLTKACMSADPAENNCIVSSGLLEGIEGKLIPDKLESTWRMNHQFLTTQLDRGQADGSVRNDLRPEELANIAMVLISGLRVSARAIKEKSQFKNAVQQCLELLKPRR
jgi:TetR/AcrR family transcriptional regulator, transcriptional repressor for nem operon